MKTLLTGLEPFIKTFILTEEDIPSREEEEEIVAYIAKEIKKEIMKKIKIDFSSWFYKNCKRQRKNNAKICQVCPFRSYIEEQERKKENE